MSYINEVEIPKVYGYKPIYASPVSSYMGVIADLLRIVCTDPEYVIFFETQEYDVMNLREFYKSVVGESNYDYRNTSRFVGEYIVREIRPENVINITKVGDKKLAKEINALNLAWFSMSEALRKIMSKIDGKKYTTQLNKDVLECFFERYDDEYRGFIESLIEMNNYKRVTPRVMENYNSLIDSFFKRYIK